jgi:TRAP-type mannitol/chloroaromatic compound transport system permease large subunit
MPHKLSCVDITKVWMAFLSVVNLARNFMDLPFLVTAFHL